MKFDGIPAIHLVSSSISWFENHFQLEKFIKPTHSDALSSKIHFHSSFSSIRVIHIVHVYPIRSNKRKTEIVSNRWIAVFHFGSHQYQTCVRACASVCKRVRACVCMCEHMCIDTNGPIFLHIFFALFHSPYCSGICILHMEYGFLIVHDEDTLNFPFPFSRLASIRCSPNTTDPIFTNIKSTWKTLNPIQWDFVAVAHSFYKKKKYNIFTIQCSSPCVFVSETVNMCVCAGVCSLQSAVCNIFMYINMIFATVPTYLLAVFFWGSFWHFPFLSQTR